MTLTVGLALTPGTDANGTARAAVELPVASADSSSPATFAPGSPPSGTASSAAVARTALPRNGTGATDRPTSSDTTADSRNDAPAPPNDSGISRPAQPTSAASVRHSPVS